MDNRLGREQGAATYSKHAVHVVSMLVWQLLRAAVCKLLFKMCKICHYLTSLLWATFKFCYAAMVWVH